MQRDDSQERMEAVSMRAASSPAPWDFSPLGCSLRSAKRWHISPIESPSTSQESIVTTFLRPTDTFDGRSQWCVDNWNTSMPSSRHSVLHDAHVASQQHLAKQKSAFFDCVGR
jgi:hypothetical protein